MNPIIQFFAYIGQNFTPDIDTESGKLGSIPNFIIGFSYFMSANAILQAIGDIVLEIAILGEFVSFKLPFRFEFLFLTLLSAIIARLTLIGMSKGDLDVTRNTMFIGLTVESALLLGDIWMLAFIKEPFWVSFFVRAPFMFFTSCNIAIIAYILIRRFMVKKARPNYQF